MGRNDKTDTFASAELILRQFPGLVVWKDTQSRYLGCNERFAKLTGFASPDQAVGQFDEDMRTPAAASAEVFKIQDQQVLKQQQPMLLLDLQPFINNQSLVVLTKKSLLKDQNENPIGTLCHLTEVSNHELLQISAALRQADEQFRTANLRDDYQLANTYPSLNLTRREAECLFFILRGKTSRSIGELLGISKRTVETHTEKLKAKLKCSSKAELIEKAIIKGYMHVVPNSLLSKKFVEQLK